MVSVERRERAPACYCTVPTKPKGKSNQSAVVRRQPVSAGCLGATGARRAKVHRAHMRPRSQIGPVGTNGKAGRGSGDTDTYY